MDRATMLKNERFFIGSQPFPGNASLSANGFVYALVATNPQTKQVEAVIYYLDNN